MARFSAARRPYGYARPGFRIARAAAVAAGATDLPEFGEPYARVALREWIRSHPETRTAAEAAWRAADTAGRSKVLAAKIAEATVRSTVSAAGSAGTMDPDSATANQGEEEAP